jgi:hypothetical protein
MTLRKVQPDFAQNADPSRLAALPRTDGCDPNVGLRYACVTVDSRALPVGEGLRELLSDCSIRGGVAGSRLSGG